MRALALVAALVAAAIPAGSAGAASHAPARNSQAPPPSPPVAGPDAGPFRGTGMWIWQLARSSGGNLAAIAARAQSRGITTVYVKSSDGRTWWPQFSPALIAGLKGAGIRVCAWQFVYGRSPVAEARLGIRAARLGADCLVIDAEQQYEGRYAQADTYVRSLRAGVGAQYPVGLTGFPYVDYHPSFPYTVFLGPQGAQFNLPQMYWRAIGTTVDRVYSHTMTFNLPYARQIFPLGQLWQNPTTREIIRFRQLAQAYGSTGLSWWDWQEASARGFRAIGQPLARLAARPLTPYPILRSGSRGDLVVLAQERLRSAGVAVPVNGVLASPTVRAIRSFQSASGVPATGAVDAPTWAALSRYAIARVRWQARARSGVSAAAAGGRNGPLSAWAPTVRNELGARPH